MYNPPNNANDAFRFRMNSARKLTQAIEALCDKDFNPMGIGRIDVNLQTVNEVEQGLFGITARSVLNDYGLLILPSSELDNFECTTPILGNKFVYLRQLYTNLNRHDQDTVTIFQTQGSNHITFKFGEDTTQHFTAELFENNDQTPGGKIEEVTAISDFCETVLPSRDMILLAFQVIQDGIPQPVTVSISEHGASILIGNGPIMTYTLDNMYPNITGGVMYPWQHHKATFYWAYPFVLLNAARLCPYYSVLFATEPAMYVVFLFIFPNGRLYLVKEATQVMTIDQRVYRHLINA